MYSRKSKKINLDVPQNILGVLRFRDTNFQRRGSRSSKAPESVRVRKATFSSSVSKNGEVYTPETSCMKGTSVHIKNPCMKQL